MVGTEEKNDCQEENIRIGIFSMIDGKGNRKDRRRDI